MRSRLKTCFVRKVGEIESKAKIEDFVLYGKYILLAVQILLSERSKSKPKIEDFVLKRKYCITVSKPVLSERLERSKSKAKIGGGGGGGGGNKNNLFCRRLITCFVLKVGEIEIQKLK